MRSHALVPIDVHGVANVARTAHRIRTGDMEWPTNWQ